MRILFIGDIVGKSGRDIVSSLLYSLKVENNIDIVIANGENSAHGKGITHRIYNFFINEGIDYITMGNHTYSKSEINEYMNEMDRLIVPFNHIKRTTNNYYKLVECKGIRFIITNILCSVFMNETSCEPYDAFKEVLNETKDLNPDFYFVDLHGETSSEKRIFLEYFKDYAKVVVGTHTHVQTADEAIIHDCAFITDVGMCGSYNSVIGRDIDETLKVAVDKEKTRYTVAEGDGMFCGVIIDIDETTKTPIKIERIQIRP